MSIESLIFLGIVLLVWFIASIGSWLREQIERYTRYQEAFGTHEEVLPSPVTESVQPEQATVEPPEPLPARAVARESPKRPARLRYRSQKAARQGIILMTVFGACKALETRDEF